VRRVEGLTAVEGAKEIEMALAGGCRFHSLFCMEGLADPSLAAQILSKNPEMDYFEISETLFSKTAYRESTGGMIAIVRVPSTNLQHLKLPVNPLILIIEGVEKPGNLGAIFRTADAAAVDAVICCDLPGDLFNPNTIRASLGTIFTVPLANASGDEVRKWLKAHAVKTFCTNLHKAVDYDQEDYTGASAIVVGTEASGVSESWIAFSDRNVKIPMLGKIDSMNVSVAAAIMVYEARRQRRCQK
jgi:TrmH family RNA methyltransferase